MFEVSRSSFEPHLLKQDGRNEFVQQLNLSPHPKIYPNSYISNQYDGKFCSGKMKSVSFAVAKISSKHFTLKDTILYFVVVFAVR